MRVNLPATSLFVVALFSALHVTKAINPDDTGTGMALLLTLMCAFCSGLLIGTESEKANTDDQ